MYIIVSVFRHTITKTVQLPEIKLRHRVPLVCRLPQHGPCLIHLTLLLARQGWPGSVRINPRTAPIDRTSDLHVHAITKIKQFVRVAVGGFPHVNTP